MLFFFSPRSAPPLQEVCAVKTRRRGCILAALLATAVAPLTTSASDIPHSPPTHSWAEPQGKDAAGEKIPIKDEKYDVNHIGQRGVGRGFNLYSPKRERELGRVSRLRSITRPKSFGIRRLTTTSTSWRKKSYVTRMRMFHSPSRSSTPATFPAHTVCPVVFFM